MTRAERAGMTVMMIVVTPRASLTHGMTDVVDCPGLDLSARAGVTAHAA
ncbi:hypothetical protein HLB23_31775, partial [Nocardia uniformis]|nr:hypothetical protein [Nocardia uniformis]